jgi:hypothetical protein
MNSFQEVQKIQEAKGKGHKAKEAGTEICKKDAEQEVVRDCFGGDATGTAV